MSFKFRVLLSAALLPVSFFAFAQEEAKVDPILIKATSNTIIRSFVDIQQRKRVTHAISVGSPEQIHYTYDADNGKLILLWKGEFLDATPMWHERGDGSSRPLGKVIQLGDAVPEIQRLVSTDLPWKTDTAGSGFKPKGYNLDETGRPTFKYFTYGVRVTDATRLLGDKKGIRREISLQGAADQLYIRLAKANTLIEVDKGVYEVDNKAYYLLLEGDIKPILRESAGKKEILVPIQTKISYSILFNR